MDDYARPMRVERAQKPISQRRLATLARSLVRESKLCAIATVNRDGSAHINTAYFAYGERFEIVWVSAPQARHSRNIRERSRIAIRRLRFEADVGSRRPRHPAVRDSPGARRSRGRRR